MPLYWLVSVPGRGDRAAALATLRSHVAGTSGGSGTELGELSSIPLPEFRIGTLDALIVHSDELARHDALLEATVSKTADTLLNLLVQQQQQQQSKGVKEPPVESQLLVEGKTVDHYLKSLQWDATKYRVTDRSISDVTNAIVQEATSIDSGLKTKLSQYATAKSTLQAQTNKQQGNLSVRSLAGIVTGDHVVPPSEHLTTCFVAVPKQSKSDWLQCYETLAPFVVPRSAKQIADDNDYVLYSVALFRRAVDEFIQRCREKRFVVRDFTFNPEAAEQDRLALLESEEREQMLLATLTRWCRTAFSEVFAAYIHIKIVRVFVESVLRYGLPPDFVAAAIKLRPKAESKLRKALNRTYAQFDIAGRDSVALQQQSRPSVSEGNVRVIDGSSSVSKLTSSMKNTSVADTGSSTAAWETEFASVLNDKSYTAFVMFPVDWKHAQAR